ncbi:MAG: hypothetical protein JWP12_1298 [Bacteroidetes bacterium]|nr:hypothetical protein [Bacteroidota bacterium]
MKKNIFLIFLIFPCYLFGKVNSYNFYGEKIEISFNDSLVNYNSDYLKEVNSATINDLSNYIYRYDCESIIKQLKALSQKLNLDDIGYSFLLQDFTSSLSIDENYKNIINYCLLKKSGYNVQLLYLIHETAVYDKVNYQFLHSLGFFYNGDYYCEISFDKNKEVKDMSRFRDLNLNGSNSFKLEPNKKPNFKSKIINKTISFIYKEKTMNVTIKINEQLKLYSDRIPAMSVGKSYLSAFISNEFKTSIINQFKVLFQKNDTTTNLNILLTFCQSLPYKDDREIWGQDRIFNPEQTISSDFSDCEDRVLLFSYLIKEIYGLKSVALNYADKDHLNIAINYNSKKFDHISYKMNSYTFCEPTSKGYIIGQQREDLPKTGIEDVIPLF